MGEDDPAPAGADDWEDVFQNALKELDGAFWSGSLSVAPLETGEAVESALVQIISASDPDRGVDAQRLNRLSERPRRHLADLLRLNVSLAGRLPEELSAIRELLSVEAGDALHTIRVRFRHGIPPLTRWQAALVDKLNREAEAEAQDGVSGERLTSVLATVLDDDSEKEGTGALGVLQSRLFSDTGTKVDLDDSLQWIGVRDFLQEAEVAAGMAQTMLREQPALKPSDIGLLVPDSFEYSVAVEDAFRLGGLALSGLPVERWRRDLGTEAVFHFLYCRQKPASAMALAVCLSSPLMPWSREQGAVLAQVVMNGDYRLRPLPSAGSEAHAMLALLRDGDGEPHELVRALQAFVALLDGGDEFSGHVHQARAAVDQLRAELEKAAEIDWAGLRRIVTPKFITSGESPDFNLEGVTVWSESQEPWRPVRRLMVLGFAQGHYPSALGSDPVFSADDVQAIREHIGLPVTEPGTELAQRRLRFRRQLRAASESVSFLIPRRDPRGDVLAPSESLVFMQQWFAGLESAEELIVELDAVEDRARISHLALAAPELPRPPRVVVAEDLSFQRDLLALRTDGSGGLRPESPSSLEALMVSPLAWLLRRLDAEPLLWAPESADVALLGTLAHKVFEGLFRSEEPLPSRDEIPARVAALLEEAIRYIAPFLWASQWQVERRHFRAETTKAAQVWRDVLERLGAEVLASEAWLQGTWSGVPIHGQTDLILGLPGERLLVVDYKRSKSTSRRPRMDKGYDSQASLYRTMLQSGGPRDVENKVLVARIRGAVWTGIVYYMLNDQVSLSDSVLPESGAVPGWQALETDVAGRAMALIRRRLAEVRVGRVCLNREGDAVFFEKQAGIKPYALANSPLIGLFNLPGEAQEVE